MNFWEAFAAVIASAAILALILGLFTLLNAWLIRRETTARLREGPPKIPNKSHTDERGR